MDLFATPPRPQIEFVSSLLVSYGQLFLVEFIASSIWESTSVR